MMIKALRLSCNLYMWHVLKTHLLRSLDASCFLQSLLFLSFWLQKMQWKNPRTEAMEKTQHNPGKHARAHTEICTAFKNWQMSTQWQEAQYAGGFAAPRRARLDAGSDATGRPTLSSTGARIAGIDAQIIWSNLNRLHPSHVKTPFCNVDIVAEKTWEAMGPITKSELEAHRSWYSIC